MSDLSDKSTPREPSGPLTIQTRDIPHETCVDCPKVRDEHQREHGIATVYSVERLENPIEGYVCTGCLFARHVWGILNRSTSLYPAGSPEVSRRSIRKELLWFDSGVLWARPGPRETNWWEIISVGEIGTLLQDCENSHFGRGSSSNYVLTIGSEI